MARYRKWIPVFLCAAFLIPVISKALPWVREHESYRSVISKEVFRSKMLKSPPAWMIAQVDRDFQDFNEKVSLKVLETTFRTISERVGPTAFYHYRILNNELYKFVPPGTRFSDTDTPLEKALKTLLIYADVPDVDFILCPMDGLPEPYMPPRFFVMENEKDQAPILAKAKMRDAKYVVLIPDQFSLGLEWVRDIRETREANRGVVWQQKKATAAWRGCLTDIGQPNGKEVTHFSSCPRFVISIHSLEYPALIDAGISWVEPNMMSILQKEGVMKGALSKAQHLSYKYLPVLDGHMCTYPGYQWRLLSNSVCFKQESDQIQWFYSAIKPYVHYVPIQNDMSDLVEKIHWAQKHDEEMIQISKRAQEFASNHLLYEDDYLFLFLVLQRHAAVEDIDFKLLKNETCKDPQWKCIQYRKRLALKKSIDRALSCFH